MAVNDAQLDHLDSSLLPINIATVDGKGVTYADVHYHHLTELPESLKENVQITLNFLENQLRERMQAKTSRDNDRYRQLLKMWRAFGQSNKGASHSWVDKKQFREIMKVLGLFATEKQASALFERYDINGDGKLTVFEFIKRCRTNDYQKLDVDDVTTNLVSQTKKEYTTSRPQRMDSMPWSIDDLCLKLREKCEQNYPVGQTASFPRLRRELARAFEFTDFTFLRYVPREGLVRTLDFINFSMHANYISMLMSAFPAQPLKGETVPLFSYPAFVLALFPTAVKAPAMSLTFRPADEQKSQKEYEDANRNQSTGFLKGGSRALTARPPSHAAPKERPRSRLQIVGSRHVRPQYQKAWFKPREALAPPAGTCLAAEALQWVDDTPQMATRGIKSVPRRPMTSRLP